MSNEQKNELDMVFSESKFISNLIEKVLEKCMNKKDNIVEIAWNEICNEFSLNEYIENVESLNRDKKYNNMTILELNKVYTKLEKYPVFYSKPGVEKVVFIDDEEKCIKYLKSNGIDNNKQLNNCEINDLFDNQGKMQEYVKRAIENITWSKEIYELDIFLELMFEFIDKEKEAKFFFDFDNWNITNLENYNWKCKNSKEDDMWVIIDKFNENNKKKYPFNVNVNMSECEYIIRAPNYCYSMQLEAVFNKNYEKIYGLKENKTGNEKEYRFEEIKKQFEAILNLRKTNDQDETIKYFIGFLLEKTIGFNISSKIYETLISEFKKSSIIYKQEEYMRDISICIDLIMSIPNTYGRLHVVKLIFEIYFDYIRNKTDVKIANELKQNISNKIANQFYFRVWLMDCVLKGLIEKGRNRKEIFYGIDQYIQNLCKKNSYDLLENGLISSQLIKNVGYIINDKEIINRKELYVKIQKNVIRNILKIM
jgi:hypothetical protein